MPKPAPASPQQVSIATRIAQARMQRTPSHQQIADYVLKRPLQAATMPIDELAAAVGVSVATANRFARAIGLDGYPMLRAELVKGFEAMLAPVEKMRVRLEKPGSAHDAFVAVLDESQNNIAATRAALDPAACAAAVQAVAAARRIYVLGYGASGWLAGLLARGLDMHCENVHLLSSVAGTTDGARQLPRMGAQDLFIVISLRRAFATRAVCAALPVRQGRELPRGEFRDHGACADRSPDQRRRAAHARHGTERHAHDRGRAALAARRGPRRRVQSRAHLCRIFRMKTMSHAARAAVPVIAIHGGAGTLHHVQLGFAPEQRLLGGAHPGSGDDRCAGRDHCPALGPRTVAGKR